MVVASWRNPLVPVDKVSVCQWPFNWKRVTCNDQTGDNASSELTDLVGTRTMWQFAVAQWGNRSTGARLRCRSVNIGLSNPTNPRTDPHEGKHDDIVVSYEEVGASWGGGDCPCRQHAGCRAGYRCSGC